MGLISNPLRRNREKRLPMYHNVRSHNKERPSDDDEYYTTDSESESSVSGPSSRGSRTASGSAPSNSLLMRKRGKPTGGRAQSSSLYPYRLPPKIIRYVVFSVIGLLGLMIIILIRASQLENWKVTNHTFSNRPPPPPVWEKFPFMERYYGGIRTLLPADKNKPEYPRLDEPVPLNPIPADSRDVNDPGRGFNVTIANIPPSNSWMQYPGRSKEDDDVQECFLDAAGKVRPPPLRYFNGRPTGFPEHVIGSYEILNLPEDICFERYGKFGAYGFGYSTRKGGLGTGETGENEGFEAVWASIPRVDYRNIDWADVQRRCYQAHEGRYKALPAKTPTPHGFYVDEADTAKIAARDVDTKAAATTPTHSSTAAAKDAVSTTMAKPDDKTTIDEAIEKRSRTAVVIRCWDEFAWHEDDVANLRAMITELSLTSGGRYDVHLLVQVKNDGKFPIWADHEIYQQRIKDTIPKEFQGLVTLWSETQMLAVYQGIYDLFTQGPSLPVHGVYRGLAMAMQHFAYLHPEYDYFWQWEMDIRYTGHYYDLLTKLEGWSKAQPRKGLWERNARFYFPSVHGSWEDFSQMSRVQSEMGTVSAENVWKKVPGVEDKVPEGVAKPERQKTIWGAVPPEDKNDWFDPVNDPFPPTSYDADRYKWGVGEEADLITLNPIFDPDGTTWMLRDDITGYSSLPARRASIIATTRMSRRLLITMHKMTSHKKQFAFPEMWPATVALQHGLKAVYAPHPIFVDRKWPVKFMAQTYNAGRDGTTGGSKTSLYGDREHNLLGLTWFYNSGFGPNLYRRWLGLKVNNDGGEEFEKVHDKSKLGTGVGAMPGGEGRMCLPPMLLHPVKEVDIPIEAPPEELLADPVPESDPTS